MAKANAALIQAIRRTAEKLKKGNDYMWGHMGSCNCGNLAQEITQLTRADIHAYAMRGHGDWSDQINDFCPTSGMPMDLLISEMLSAGLDREDLVHLERLSDQEVLGMLPLTERNLRHNHRDDVVKYLMTWASALEDELLDKVNISDATQPSLQKLSLL
ncbi:MAG: hypothetical protein ACMVP2_17660 [Imperialibacter sp.]|uniref:hypothetical protein n=1 Tax=Imperialibacter sp. TaxID=2038411 RepID=UPI003A8A6E82